MEKLDKYRDLVKKLINKYGQYKPKYGDIEVQKIFDVQGDHYQLMNVGWHGNRRLRGCVLQIDLKNDKIWIQHDGTEIGVADELVDPAATGAEEKLPTPSTESELGSADKAR